MMITKVSQLTGTTHTKDIPVDPFKYLQYMGYKNPPYIQDEFPELSNSDREFILTGITDEEWREYFGD